MTDYTDPLGRNYPNWEAVIEDSIPILCTILFGFCATYFAAIAVLDPATHILGAHSFDIRNDYLLKFRFRWKFDVRTSLLILIGVDAASFYVSAMASVHAKMLNTDRFVQRSTDTNQIGKDEDALKYFKRMRSRSLTYSMTSVNLGVFLLPITAFILLPTLGLALLSILYVFVCAYAVRGNLRPRV